MGVATGKMSMDEVRQFAHYICNLSDQENCNTNRVQSIILNEDKASAIGDYPEHWIDAWHEKEGGCDAYGVRPQYGVTLLQAEMSGLSYKNGYETAWDVVSNENLVPELVHGARTVEMEYFAKLGVYEKVLRSHQIFTGGNYILECAG